VAFGVFSEIFRWAKEEYDELKGIDWEWQMMDGSLVPAPDSRTKSLS
jgi:putative transposase